jgi:phosphate transport system substrate-binding protein
MRKRKMFVGAAAVLSVALVAAACSSNEDTGSSSGSSPAGGGAVVVSGSSTVQPITSLVAEKFNADNPDVSIKVDGPGTGDGFVLFCEGQTDINDASRPIEDTEAADCKTNGVTYTELKVGLDGVTVMTSANNTAVTCLTNGDLYALFGPESQGFTSWADANALAQDQGGKGQFPDAPLDITAPGEESGTYDAFIDLAGIEDAALANKVPEDQAATLRPDYQSSPNDNVIIQGIEGSDTSLGFVGFAFADQAGTSVKKIAIDGGDGCVDPNPETIADGSYPLSRSLYIYVNNEKLASNPALKSFVDFYLTDAGLASVNEADYVDMPADQKQATLDAWAQATA